jgi:dTDP-glucose 4,6-dehydratase
VALRGQPGEVYCYGQGENIRIGDWAELILGTGQEHGFWGPRRVVSTSGRFRPGSTDVLMLRVGYEKLHRETGWKPTWTWEDGLMRTIEWYASHRERWMPQVDWR